MIDDLTIAARVSGIDGIPDGMLPLDTVRGRPEMFGASRRNGQLFVKYCPETQIASVRISVPRWIHSSHVNFPLASIRSADDLGLNQLACEVGAALGVHLSSIGTDGIKRFPVNTWPVIRVSFAVDLVVRDPLASMHAYRGIDRRHPGRFTTFGIPTSMVEWSSRSLRVKFYAKGLEIQSHRPKGAEEAELRQGLSERARRVLRFEVSFLEVRSLRAFLCLENKSLPSLAFICDPRIGAWALTREAVRLRLGDDYSTIKTTSVPERVRHVGAVLLERQAALAASEGKLSVGRRKTITPGRLWDLAATHVLASGFTLDELVRMSGRSRSAMAELVAELRDLGIPPDLGAAGSVGAAVEEISDQLLPHLLSEFPPDLTNWRVRDAFVHPPWEEEHVPKPNPDQDEVSF